MTMYLDLILPLVHKSDSIFKTEINEPELYAQFTNFDLSAGTADKRFDNVVNAIKAQAKNPHVNPQVNALFHILNHCTNVFMGTGNPDLEKTMAAIKPLAAQIENAGPKCKNLISQVQVFLLEHLISQLKTELERLRQAQRDKSASAAMIMIKQREEQHNNSESSIPSTNTPPPLTRSKSCG